MSGAARLLGCVLATAALARVAAAQPPAPSGAEIARAFIERQYEMTPVAGEFVIVGQSFYDTPDQPQPRVEDVKPGQAVAVREPSNRELRCRWAFDQHRELLDPLAGGEGFAPRFLVDRGGMLDSVNPGSYTLRPVGRVSYYRPASFFFLNASCDRWEMLLIDGSPELSAERRGDVTLLNVAAQPPGQLRYVLELETATYLLKSARSFVGDKVVSALTIDGYSTDSSGKKKFPRQASYTLTMPTTGKLRRTEQLRTVSIHFPDTKAAIDAAFKLDLPKGTGVADTQLNRRGKTDKATTAANVIANPSALPSKPFATPAEVIPGPVSAVSDGWVGSGWEVVAVATGAVLIVAGIWRLRRPRRGREAETAGPG